MDADEGERIKVRVTFSDDALQFSEAPDVSYTVLRDEAFEVTGGEVCKAQRVDGRHDLRQRQRDCLCK